MTHIHLSERQFPIPASPGHRNLIAHIQKAIEFRLEDGVIPVRFAITQMDETHYQCEFGTLEGLDDGAAEGLDPIFRFVPRKFERTDAFNAVFLVPTGIGAEIGGHAGDSTPAARVLAEACDCLVTHTISYPGFSATRAPAGDAFASARVFDAPRSRDMRPAGRLPKPAGCVARRL